MHTLTGLLYFFLFFFVVAKAQEDLVLTLFATVWFEEKKGFVRQSELDRGL